MISTAVQERGQQGPTRIIREATTSFPPQCKHRGSSFALGSCMPTESGWSGLFWEAFKRSKNAMVLLDEQRRHVEVNGGYLELLGYRRGALIGRPIYEFVADGPVASNREWRAALHQTQFTGKADLVHSDGRRIKVEFAGHPELVTGRKLVLFVALKTARAVRLVQHSVPPGQATSVLSKREVEITALIAAGLSGPEIAQDLQVTHNTVRTHVRNAMAKTGARSRASSSPNRLPKGCFGLRSERVLAHMQY